jgi:hypothetical protein
MTTTIIALLSMVTMEPTSMTTTTIIRRGDIRTVTGGDGETGIMTMTIASVTETVPGGTGIQAEAPVHRWMPLRNIITGEKLFPLHRPAPGDPAMEARHLYGSLKKESSGDSRSFTSFFSTLV